MTTPGAVLAASNDGCSVAAAVADCDDVPEDGIAYSQPVTTVNVGDDVQGVTTVTDGTPGIVLRQNGANASSAQDAVAFTTMSHVVGQDGDGEDIVWTVVATSASGTNVPVKLGGEFIKVEGETYKAGSTSYTAAALAEALYAGGVEAGQTFTAQQTVNNGVGGAPGASFITNNATGILVESIGGRGGNGGCSTVLLIYTWCSDGKTGGNAASMAVNSNGAITVYGTGYGVSAISRGGAGGKGGGSIGLGSSAGGGGDGGVGGSISVSLGTQSVIITNGAGGHGVYVSSRGGDGGAAGNSAGAVAVGDSGGDGGDAGEVTVVNSGSITTKGAKAHGIYAESVGAGAGSGSDTGGIVAIGGGGGGQSNGSDVHVINSGAILTEGKESFGILAQSIGGGGGDGGSAGGLFSVGGKGGSGGNGGIVDVTNSGSIETRKAGAIGIMAQSIGGGGGNGGDAIAVGTTVSVAVGGDGGLGGDGANVTVDTVNPSGSGTTSIKTGGFQAHGIMAQSVGGGGGNGGLAVSATAGGTNFSASVALGGNGDNGGIGQDVVVNAAGQIETGGEASHGIFAQSIGGGGGSGGGAVAASAGAPMSFNFAMGGRGAGGGGAGEVTVTTAALSTIKTTAAGSIGILAQSVGGGGGNGGFSAAAGAAPFTTSIALGGTGAGGGAGAKVGVDNKATITTFGANATGILAQSIGGGGGNGGFAVGASFGVVSVSAALGGSGAGGGIGDAVTVTNAGAISTQGNLAYGIQAQSVGGGGGNGGFALALSAAFSPDPEVPAVAVAVSVGGSGGTGGNGGAVRVANIGTIETAGAATHGVFAQSVGGGGGNGGFAASGVLTIGKNAGSVTVAVGGSGDGGGNGGKVTVGRDADDLGVAGQSIITHGDGANAIFAQSVGGGGGNGGLAVAVNLGKGEPGGASFNLGVSVGGSGAGGGDGDVVDVYSNQLLRTYGDNATALIAQSVGGGGGIGGSAITGMLQVVDTTDPASQAVNVAVAIGGGGGDGGAGKKVIVENRGAIVTGEVVKVNGVEQYDEDGALRVAGASAHGIFAQSVGGGGGAGGNANSISMILGRGCGEACPPDPAVNVSMRVSVGGKGGDGSDGGEVTVTNSGSITTLGAVANGIFAQSVGGGGGTGGNGVLGSGGLIPIPIDLIANLTLGKTKKYSDLGVAVGGNGGGVAHGGVVKVNNDGDITTYGSNSTAIIAQSIGGGGGIGGVGNIGATGTVGVGGKGTSGGDGGLVEVKQLGGASITTYGTSAFGVFAESVGGGGGLAGNVNRLLATPIGPVPALNVGMGLALGQGGGKGGDGGNVNVIVEGDITTHGDSATAIFAHSVGGGGGTRGELGNDVPVLSLLSWHIGSNGDVGDAGIVTVEVEGEIRTAGNNATGIFAQSAGGSAGTDLNDQKGQAGDVNITVTGIVETAALLSLEDGTIDDPLRGLGAIGIVAHSAGGAGNGNITITLDSTTGKVIGGRSSDDYTGVGIQVIDGLDNVVTNYGLITTADGVDLGYAILAYGSNPEGLASDGDLISPMLVAGSGKVQDGGDESIVNFGTVTGSIDLGVGENSFLNHVAATFNTGRVAMLGADNTLDNEGRLSPGGDGKVMTTAVTGNVQQADTGTFAVDLDMGLSGEDGTADATGSADRITASGVVEMDGRLTVALLNAGQAKTGTHSAIIAASDTADGLTDSGLELDTAASVILDYWLATSPEQLILNYSVDFSPEGLVGNQISIGDYLGAIQSVGGNPALEPLINGLVYLPDMQAYAKALDQLSPEPYVSNEMSAYLATLEFEKQLMSCRVASGEFRFSAEGECAWATIAARQSRFESVDGHAASRQEAVGMAAGAQVAVNENVRLGFGASYNQIQNQMESASSSGHALQAGGVVKLQSGDTTLALAAMAGYGTFDVTRVVAIPQVPVYTLNGQQDVAFVGAHARLSHTFSGELGYLRPSVDIGVTELFQLGFNESGGPVALVVDAQRQLYVTATPAIELGGEIKLGSDAVLRPFVRGGAQLRLFGSEPGLAAGFADAPVEAGVLAVAGRLDPVLIDLSVGFDLISGNGIAVKLTGEAQLGETQRSYGANVKFSAPF
ncbi:MAG TPA: hypothetical protein PK286_03885 [Devosia sp.]|nr:hypothetical protein [Devosia sp.]